MSAPSKPLVTPVPPVPKPARRLLRVAWVSVALIPVSFVVAMVLGDWLLSVQGYSSGEEDLPLKAVLLAGLPALLVLLMPSIAAIWFGLRAKRRGAPQGFIPVAIGATVAAASVALNSVSVIARLLGLGGG